MSKQEERVWKQDVKLMKPALGINEMPKSKFKFFIYGWQHTLVDVSPFIIPFVMAGALGYSDQIGVEMVQAGLIAMMFATLIQTIFGNKLPIMQGPSSTNMAAMITVGNVYGPAAMWSAAIVGGLFESAIGASKILTLFRRFLPPYISGIIIVSIGVSLGFTAANWVFDTENTLHLLLAGVVIISVVTLTILGRGGLISRGSVLFSLLLVGLGITSIFGVANWQAVVEANWLSFPKPFKLLNEGGGFVILIGALIGVFIGYLGSIVESIGDYSTTCAASNEVYKVKHINRGITAEGISASLAAMIGSIPVSSYSQNTGIIVTTKIASRYVVMLAAVIIGIYGLSPKVGSLLLVIPRPIIGAVFLVICGMIIVTGMRLIGTAPANDYANYNIAIPLIMGICLPQVVPQDADWFTAIPSFFQLSLTNGVVCATIIGIIMNILLNPIKKEQEEEIKREGQEIEQENKMEEEII